MTPDEQKKLDNRLLDAAGQDDTGSVLALLVAGADVHADNDWALCIAARYGHTETVEALLAVEANVHARDDGALLYAAYWGYTETVRVLAKHIFAPDSWRGKTREEIEAKARDFYHRIEADNPKPECLLKAAKILADCCLDCWFQVRPPPPKLNISPYPAQPRPL